MDPENDKKLNLESSTEILVSRDGRNPKLFKMIDSDSASGADSRGGIRGADHVNPRGFLKTSKKRVF